eukprot:5437601-Prymnesium_polylepis.1
MEQAARQWGFVLGLLSTASPFCTHLRSGLTEMRSTRKTMLVRRSKTTRASPAVLSRLLHHQQP